MEWGEIFFYIWYVLIILTILCTQVALLDFGACREYSKEFVDKYINLIYGAAMKDRERVLKYSQDLGFLTGYEAKVREGLKSAITFSALPQTC